MNIFSKEWLNALPDRTSADFIKMMCGNTNGYVEFYFEDSRYPKVSVYKGKELFVEELQAFEGYRFLSYRETGKIKYKFAQKYKTSKSELELAVTFHNNDKLLAAIFKACERGDNSEVKLSDYKNGFPRRAIVYQRRVVEYDIRGVEALSEISFATLLEYWNKRDEYKDFDNFILSKKREEMLEKKILKH